jgi:hypothetical protein
MRAYGTDVSFKAKTANIQPIAHRMAQIVLGRQLLHRIQQARGPEVRHTAQAEMMNTTFRMLELARMERAIDNANHTVAPIILPADYGENLPIGMTEGMIRMASVIGGNMAKVGGVMRQPYRGSVSMPPPMPDLDLAPSVPSLAAPPARPKASVRRAPDLSAKVTPHGQRLREITPETGSLGAFWDRTGLSKGRASWKIPALLAAGVGTYAALKGGEKLLNWGKGEMSEPIYGRGSGNLELAPGLNQYDQPQYLAAGH